MIHKEDSKEFLKKQADFSADIIYSDPPYALGSEIIVREDGKVDYHKASDFMDKWDMPTGEWWEEWFKEAFRTLKYGGHCVMFGMDRQLLLFKYYAHLAGFTEKQSMYWYFISNFPKATDLSKMIMKNRGDEGKETGEVKKHAQKGVAVAEERGAVGGGAFGQEKEERIKEPTDPLAQKYDGYKYSIAPLKQTNETIMVFQKPYKTGSGLHDTLEMEEGNEEITCGAIDVDGNRVGTVGGGNNGNKPKEDGYASNPNDTYGKFKPTKRETEPKGRYPSQTYCDTGASGVLDEQSGVSKTPNSYTVGKQADGNLQFNKKEEGYKKTGYGDTAGCSKILHKCDFEEGEFDLYHYCPKVSKKERNAGLEDREDKGTPSTSNGGKDGAKMTVGGASLKGERKSPKPTKNNHPTLKPIALNEKILRLFKTPNEQKILYPFAGAGSEVIGGIKAGFDNWEGCELSEEYIKIAEARIEHWSKEQTLF